MTVITALGDEQSHTMASYNDAPMEENPNVKSAAPTAESASSERLSAGQKESVRRIMLERLSVSSGAHFVHQQRDTADLTQQEKVDIAAEVLHKNPASFLARFGKYLHSSDLAFFQDTDESDYETQFYLKELHHRCTHSDLIVKNRRYAALKELEAGGSYFSEDEMKHREPLLYEQMIGQHLTEEEQEQQAAAAIDRSDLRFSTILLAHMDVAQQRVHYNEQKEVEDCQEEEEDSSDEEDDEDNQGTHKHKQRMRSEEGDEDESDAEDLPEISDARATGIWRQQLREEFTSVMHEKFLSGNDENFDYSQVDDNPDYDSLTTIAQDEEYRYFQSEDPVNVGEDMESTDSEIYCKGKVQVTQREKEEEEEEEEDYMLYQPPPDLVTKSANFVLKGSWKDDDDDNT